MLWQTSLASLPSLPRLPAGKWRCNDRLRQLSLLVFCSSRLSKPRARALRTSGLSFALDLLSQHLLQQVQMFQPQQHLLPQVQMFQPQMTGLPAVLLPSFASQPRITSELP